MVTTHVLVNASGATMFRLGPKLVFPQVVACGTQPFLRESESDALDRSVESCMYLKLSLGPFVCDLFVRVTGGCTQAVIGEGIFFQPPFSWVTDP